MSWKSRSFLPVFLSSPCAHRIVHASLASAPSLCQTCSKLSHPFVYIIHSKLPFPFLCHLPPHSTAFNIVNRFLFPSSALHFCFATKNSLPSDFHPIFKPASFPNVGPVILTCSLNVSVIVS